MKTKSQGLVELGDGSVKREAKNAVVKHIKNNFCML